MRCSQDNLCKMISTAIVLCAAFVATQKIQAATEEDLEPCINGGVSATGIYPSQVEEDQAQLNAVVNNDQIFDQLALESYGAVAVSATDMYHDQELDEDVAEQRVQAEDDDC